MKLTILRGCRNPEIENSHPSAAESLLLAKMCVFCCRGSPVGGHRMHPRGDPKNHRNSIIFRKLFQWSLGGHRIAKVSSRTPQGTEKGSRRVTFGALWNHFWPQNCDIGTLLEHCYLHHFRHKMKAWDHSDALWEAIWNSILRAVTTLGVSSALLCPAGSS